MTVVCVPLCAATKAYGKYVKWWQHEAQCPARINPNCQWCGRDDCLGPCPQEPMQDTDFPPLYELKQKV